MYLDDLRIIARSRNALPALLKVARAAASLSSSFKEDGPSQEPLWDLEKALAELKKYGEGGE